MFDYNSLNWQSCLSVLFQIMFRFRLCLQSFILRTLFCCIKATVGACLLCKSASDLIHWAKVLGALLKPWVGDADRGSCSDFGCCRKDVQVFLLCFWGCRAMKSSYNFMTSFFTESAQAISAERQLKFSGSCEVALQMQLTDASLTPSHQMFAECRARPDIKKM